MKLKLANEEITIMVSENEEMRRKLLLGEQEVTSAKESEEEYKKKLEDKLYLGWFYRKMTQQNCIKILAEHQKCSSCLASEKIRNRLTSELAGKDRQIMQAKADCAQVQAAIFISKKSWCILAARTDRKPEKHKPNTFEKR